MIKDKRLVNFLINKYIDEKNYRWNLANKVLYDLCEKYPKHTDEHEIVAKMWLIGRSYAAAIERRNNAKDFEGDFYYDAVAPMMILCGNELDEKISKLTDVENEDAYFTRLFECHLYLTNIFNSLTELNKRSLASKYLHFHKPQSVFIYDSITSTNIRKIVSKNTQKNMMYKEYDAEYVDFGIRIVELQNYIKSEFGVVLTPRELDTFLLNMKISE